MNDRADFISHCLREVQQQREARAGDPTLATRVVAVKQFQHQRFAHTYADLLASPRYAGAASFFLQDLYGPDDFSERDRQFMRVVPALVKVFPRDLLATIADLASLHALSERLDTAMGRALSGAPIDAASYGRAWRVGGEPESRERQIALMASIGSALDRYTRHAWVRRSLRLMRGPAQAAGLSALQSFLERGFDTFCGMDGAAEFLDIISRRERALAAQLFAGGSP